MDVSEIIKATEDAIIGREGGSNTAIVKIDKGGPTKYGITAAALGDWRKLGRPATADEVEGLSELEARAIIRSEYIEKPGLMLLVTQPALFELVADCSVHHGPARAVKFLQRSLGVKDDGVFGSVTRAALLKGTGSKLYRDVLAERCLMVGRWISGDKTDADHDGVTDTAELAAGILARIAGFVRETP